MMRPKFLPFVVLLVGVLVGLVTWPHVEAQAPALLFGTLSGAPKAVAVDSNGALQTTMTGLTDKQILYGSATGGISQSAAFGFGTLVGSGASGSQNIWVASSDNNATLSFRGSSVNTGLVGSVDGLLGFYNPGALGQYVDASGDIQINGPAMITAGSGTGVTVNYVGSVRELVYKVTVLRTNFICAALTCDLTVATLPAKTFLKHAIIDLTTTFACSATCTTSTLSATLGKTAGGNQYLLSFDIDAATGQFGDAAAELGASIAPATVPTGDGDLGSWSSTTAVTLRITSGTGNIGTGAATNFSQGTMVIELTTIAK